MNKRQRKKWVLKNVLKFYDMVFERDHFRRDVAIVCGRNRKGKRMLTIMMIKSQIYEYNYGEYLGISLEGYAVERKVLEEQES
ncbi:hypothetical protein [Streptococcus vestibularis]|uniref:hypothetical protein n=1 Tax=Streptococcus vestibularis TaxID=1343 RepID=UPI002204DA7F|nr:hypothetical protein [Streptococcus vestibularis]MCI5926174.1 hypothetical protein [Streptococcus vestibularis]UVY16106.1 MAG: hypothetical protein [Bacteriophage sp.]